MKILFDSQIYDLQKFGGISRMYVDLHNEWNKTEDVSSDFSVSVTNNFYLNNVKSNITEKSNNRIFSIKMIESGDYDILYPTFFDTYFLEHLHGKPFVMSVHDMIPELYPQFFSRNDLQIVGKREMVKYASAIEVPTETTKRDLIKILGVDENKIHVIGRGINENFGVGVKEERIVDYKYVLYVGQRNAYKRFDWFIKYSSIFFKKHEEVHLICCGNDFTESEKELLDKNGILNKTHAFKPNDAVLANLYKHAEFFVFSSEYEGFGLPVLESYKMGCIALLNDNDCFREITFGKGTFFSMNENESNLSDVMENIYTMTEEDKAEIVKIQNDIFSNYSLSKTAYKLAEMIKSVVNKPKKDNLDIFICTHKDFKPLVSNPVYKIVNSSNIDNDTWNELKGSFYSEIMSYFYIAKNYPLKDYVGFCHYRKYWEFMDKIPDIEYLISKYGVITARRLSMKKIIKKQYAFCHNIEDLYIIGGILAEKYPSYVDSWNEFLNDNKLFPYNMFIMKREEFLEYIKFMENILDEFVNIIGKDVEKRIYDNYEKYMKDFSPNNEVWYQYRIGGYLAERLTNVWLLKNHDKIGTIGVKITSSKYGIKKEGEQLTE